LAAPAAELGEAGAVAAGIDRLVAGAREAGSPPSSVRGEVCALLAETLAKGRARIAAALEAEPRAGLRAARAYAHVTDLAVTGAWHYAARHLHPLVVRTTSEHLAVGAVGGYGRGEMAPYSDVDLLFLMPYRQTAWGESLVETMLYLLWDLKLKVGHSVRSIADCIRLGQQDTTIRTALLELRFLAGDAGPFDQLRQQLRTKLFAKTAPEFVEAKLAEREGRHARHGGSRYLLEPNVKESKGGLRDLQTLHWIARYIYGIDTAWELVDKGVYEQDEVSRFAEAGKFIWAVRCHLHMLADRAQERLTFDRQVEIAERMGFSEHDGRMAVEHFMHAYFRHAKNVGDLTRIFSAALEAQHAKRPPRLSTLLRALSFRSGRDEAGPFSVRDGRLTVSGPEVFAADPVNLLRLFHQAARLDAHIHPSAMRLVTQSLDLIDDRLRADPEANSLFLEMLTDRRNGHWLMRRMNETDVLGRFVPDFGRVVCMMQFNMYHHYTVDEHTLQAIEVLNRIDQLEAEDDHPAATEILRGNVNRRVLYVALFLHDVGKGAGRDHSEVGAEVALRLCPRLGLDAAETETVAWLVRHHLLMSDVAQKRDITDPRTVRDFARAVQSPERLRLLLVLTVCDIRGVGPGVWNNWKAQLLRHLYGETRERLTGSAETPSNAARVEEAKEALAARLSDWGGEERARELARHYPGYWLGLDTETQEIFARMARGSDPAGLTTRFRADAENDVTEACLYLGDHPGVFSRMAGAFALAGANTVDARTYTTTDGMVCTVFWIQDAEGKPFDESRLERLRRTIERTIRGEVVPRVALAERRREPARERPFTVPTRILFDNEASEIYTVIEVNARDRLGLLHVLTRTLTGLNINIFSAIIATYGAEAVDVFYVKDLFGLKIRSQSKRDQIRRRLTEEIEGFATAGGG
ncbi:MAG TPA: [protein-PII] uridylyltransferase, partial [Thermohalobaculum sp.]|nr:[protein-PII] uridylyltransferase [Thermohalobaculum sp.]